ncbi:hypothetical protein [Nonomuraea typhae]|uniref:Thioredoxin domain-containing protein n=1 Tax=Nonomuraea typhae TaxID=2603600 RepID=A0ABW7ZA77_9ACTN
MSVLIAAVVLVGVLCLFDLVLTFAVLRRLREHTAELARLSGATPPPYDPAVLVGRSLPADGTQWPGLVAFFHADCDACHVHAPAFAATARGLDAMAVVCGDGPKRDRLAEVCDGLPYVVTGERAAALEKAVGIEAFPAFLRVGADGAVVAAHLDLTALAPAG